MIHERTIVFESYLLSGYEEGVRMVSSFLRLKVLSATFLTYPPIGMVATCGFSWSNW